MPPPYLLLVKLVIAHLLTDFVLQPRKWVEQRNKLHFKSGHLYLHGFCTAALAWIITGFQHPWIALVILLTHTLIDGIKSYLPSKAIYFLIDQALHIGIIWLCWFGSFGTPAFLQTNWQLLNNNLHGWYVIAGFIFLTTPSGIFIGQFTQQWREGLADSASLANAGKWIGILERVLILVLVLNEQYEGFALLVAAKSLIRFNEKDRPELKTEYLLIGTLISISLAFFTALIIKAAIAAT
ncbi:MAG TPA: DUF3307 domain-containing protein [Phnomibacter sp.]|nr:DUF3307 domain-containing protein [Phnomibacter sp.]